jgi:hypothetical protein
LSGSEFVDIPQLVVTLRQAAIFARQSLKGRANLMKGLAKSLLVVLVTVLGVSAASAHGFKNCTKLDKASWKPASEAEAKAKAAGYEVRRSKVDGSCYEVYGVKEGKLYELFYSPEDLSLKHTVAK